MAGKLDTEGSQEPGKLDRSLSIEEAAERLGYSERTVRRRIKDGSLQAFQQPIPRGFAWRILLEKPAEVDTEGRQPSGKHDSEGSQEARQAAQEGSQEPGKLDTEAGKLDTEEPAGPSQEAPAPDLYNIQAAPAEPALLKALDMVDKLQDETKRLQEENKELYGRAAFYQAKLQDAEERLLMLEARPADEEQKAEPEAEAKKLKGSWWRRLLGKG
jgi:excisionase family DNA binding protein